MQDRRKREEQADRLKLVLLLTSSYIVVEIISGILVGSLALIADAAHMFTDAGGIALALFAVNYARKPATPKSTYGFYRAEILAALANSIILVLVSIYIIYEAYGRIFEVPEIQSAPMILVAAMGLALNLIGLKLLKRHASENLNMEGAYLEVLKDAFASIGVVMVGIIIYYTQFYVVDSIASFGLALFILPRVWTVVKKSINILMERTPIDISYEEVKKTILQTEGVTGVFGLHIWTIASGMDALTAHVVIIDPSRSQMILKQISAILEKKFNISQTTIQLETYHA